MFCAKIPILKKRRLAWVCLIYSRRKNLDSNSNKDSKPEVAVIKTQVRAEPSALEFGKIVLHPDIKNLLWFGDGPRMNLDAEQRSGGIKYEDEDGIFFTVTTSLNYEEPSLIYTELPIKKPEDESVVPRPPYFPRYKDLTPEQRYIYIKLLTNPYNADIDIGYVFILYYGLERHLQQSDFDSAFNVILKLRDAHKNKSFQQCSGGTVIMAAMQKKKGICA
jgi:hypothetical protein